MNYFKAICLVWAIIGIGSRIIMGVMGEKWAKWELNSAYKAEKPKLINALGVIAYGVVIYTWILVFKLDVAYSWVIATLMTLTVVKVSTILFNYKAFRSFAVKTLNDSKKMMLLNISVLIFSIVLIAMGIFLY